MLHAGGAQPPSREVGREESPRRLPQARVDGPTDGREADDDCDRRGCNHTGGREQFLEQRSPTKDHNGKATSAEATCKRAKGPARCLGKAFDAAKKEKKPDPVMDADLTTDDQYRARRRPRRRRHSRPRATAFGSGWSAYSTPRVTAYPRRSPSSSTTWRRSPTPRSTSNGKAGQKT